MKFRLLERICGIKDENLTRLEDYGYQFVGRTTNNRDFYRKGDIFVIYNPKTDEIIKTMRITKYGKN